MSSIHDELTTDGPARKQTRLVPYALLAIGSAAIVVPFLLLRRTRARATINELGHAPPRRAGQGTIAPRAIDPIPLDALKSSSAEPLNPGPSSTGPASGAAELDPLHALKAFGIATCIVGASALAGVWAVRQSLGVQTTEEFATQMRIKVRNVAPALSTRIYRPLLPEDTDPTATPSPKEWDEGDEWTWGDASQRLSRAYEEGGAMGWIEAAGRELEREAHLERRRRAIDESQHGDES